MTGADFLEAVGATFDVAAADLATRSRKRRCTRPRFAAYWLARALPCDGGRQRSLPEIGRLFERDHNTVMHGIAQAEAMLTSDAEFAERLAGAGEILSRRDEPPASVARHPAVLAYPVKPKNEPAANDGDALARFRASRDLLEAIRREHPERCAAQAA